MIIIDCPLASTNYGVIGLRGNNNNSSSSTTCDSNNYKKIIATSSLDETPSSFLSLTNSSFWDRESHNNPTDMDTHNSGSQHHGVPHGIGGHNHNLMRSNTVFDDRMSSSDPLYQKCNRGSHSSDTSSAYSGSDTMTSVHSSSLDPDEVDLSGLVESVVDSDEEDLAEGMDSLMVRDTVRECLEKDPSDRTDDDIEILLEFTQKLKAFTNMTLAVRKALCSVMVFAVVEKAGTMVMNDGEELDSWSVLINGHVEIEHTSGEKEELQIGDSFGILPTMDKLYHRGIMRTKCDDCQFVCITQTDYYRIQHQGEENIRKHEDENGVCVMVTEARSTVNEACGRKGYIVIRGTPERLMSQLIEENSMSDPTYIEDFLLTHRTFIDSPLVLVTKLLDWFQNYEERENDCGIDIRDRVTRVVLLWVENHFTDFESDTRMMEFLETFEQLLEEKVMFDQLSLFHIKCSAKAKIRTITLARSSRDESLNFQIIGGYFREYSGIYIVSVEKGTKSEDVGLKRGDQILEVNGQNFEHVTHSKAMELLTSTTHLCITVKNNLLGFKEILQSDSGSSSLSTSSSTSSSQRSRQLRHKKIVNDHRAKMSRLSTHDLVSTSCDQVDHAAPSNKKESNAGISTPHKSSGFMTLVPKRRLQKALIRMNLLPKNSAILDQISISSSSSANDDENTLLPNPINITQEPPAGTTSALYHSHSNPDLTSVLYYEDSRCSDYPEHVLKVYKSDQTCKYLLVHKETTSHEVVMLALREFGITDPSSNFSLCEVSVGEGGMIKQRRLPEQLQNLAERIGLSARYYLKTNGITETLVPDDMAADLIRESSVYFLQLNANEIAIQLTLQDFAVFRQIESIEYIDDLFTLKTKYGTPMLKKFAELVNKEMFWVVTEVCQEHNIVRRMKIIKQFIKIARHCKECKNFNSLFAIISGLGHVAVSRLRLTWEKLPTKYQKLFTDLQELMDPSRNMSKYRQLVAVELLAQHPLIPFYPVVKKDLTFIHLGNDTKIDNLINFEKLRMASKEIRNLIHMCSTPYDLLTTLELRGQPPSSAMVALNQMSASTTITSNNTHHLIGAATVKRRKKSTAAPNPKKMFEEAQMVRRVKAYLNNIKIVTDEDVLQQYSLECEPSTATASSSANNSAPNSVTIRKRYPSPTLSTTSSTSSTSEGKKTGPKFGAASPQAVKKILSLSEPQKTRPHQPPRHFSGAYYHHSNNSGNGAVHGGMHHHHTIAYTSPSPSPGVHRRMGSSSSAGSVPFTSQSQHMSSFVIGSANSIGVITGRAAHERSHSDTPTPLPSVDLSMESSSVTSLSNLPLRKNVTPSGSVTSSDSGHSSCVQTDTHSNSTTTDSGANSSGGSSLYHVASSIVHNSPSPTTLQQRRHSSLHVSSCGSSLSSSTPLSCGVMLSSRPPFSHAVAVLPPLPPPHPASVSNACGNSTFVMQAQLPQYITASRSGNGHTIMGAPPQVPASRSIPPRHPPSYTVAAQMARLHRMGRAHSHEGVSAVSSGAGSPVTVTNTTQSYIHHTDPGDEDDDDDGAQVSVV